MKHISLILILAASLVLVTDSNSASTGEMAVTRKRVKAFPEKQEIIMWQQALETETQKLVEAGYNNLEDIINLVSENTRELEQSAFLAYISQCIEMSQFGNELAQEAVKQFHAPELEKFDQAVSGQVNALLENSCQKNIEKNFSVRKHGLVEKFFQTAHASK